MTVEYGPGEILERLLRSPSIGDPVDGYDVILYIDRIAALTIKGDFSDAKFQVGNGAVIFQKLNFDNGDTLYAVDALDGETLFLAQHHHEQGWVIEVSKRGPWMDLLEKAYDKVCTCLDSPERWKETFPPIGIVYLNKGGTILEPSQLNTQAEERVYG